MAKCQRRRNLEVEGLCLGQLDRLLVVNIILSSFMEYILYALQQCATPWIVLCEYWLKGGLAEFGTWALKKCQSILVWEDTEDWSSSQFISV